MTELLRPGTPCTVDVETAADGGVTVTLRVPTYGGGATFQLRTERDNDGDWRVFIPWPDEVAESAANTYNEGGIPELAVLDGMEVANGILYLGAPDVEVPATWQRASQEHTVSVCRNCEITDEGGAVLSGCTGSSSGTHHWVDQAD